MGNDDKKALVVKLALHTTLPKMKYHSAFLQTFRIVGEKLSEKDLFY